MDYLGYWSLLQRPFLHKDNEGFFAGIPQREFIAGLNHFVAGDHPIGYLVSRRRCGMSWLLRHATRMRGFGAQATEMVLTAGHQASRHALLHSLCDGIGCQRSQLHAAIQSSAEQGVRVVWMVDRCSGSARSVADELTGRHPNLAVLIGVSAGSAPLRASHLRGRFPTIRLQSLAVDDVGRYLTYSVEHAGGRSELFPEATVLRLHDMTGGAIGALAIAAESALATAASQRLDCVTPAIVEAIGSQTRRAA